ncbi:uncharacterized protein LOC110978197 [Acanthaster planci]|uniref:Uncharacterized protein LOC110978197 n=1 Tax=Acanthaster planci TaxID=133434 RepID=A0A8B7Y8J8_ACAPL|nr:uncharacterized protein LOC110978197 [Acanthaster planci]
MAQKFFGPNFDAEEEWARLEAPVADEGPMWGQVVPPPAPHASPMYPPSWEMDMEHVELFGMEEVEVIDLTSPMTTTTCFCRRLHPSSWLPLQARQSAHYWTARLR